MKVGREKKRVQNPKRYVPAPIPVKIPERKRERVSVPIERPGREVNAG